MGHNTQTDRQTERNIGLELIQTDRQTDRQNSLFGLDPDRQAETDDVAVATVTS